MIRGGSGSNGDRGMDPGDGRNIDPRIGELQGEAAGQESGRRTGAEGSPPFDVWTRPGSGDPASRDEPTYYERPVLKEPVWIWAVPAYFYAGGAAGASAVLGAAAQITDRRGLDGLVNRCRWLAFGGVAVGTALLIHDLGRPERFLNMLRVFRITSPLSIGSWTLAAAGPLTAGAALFGRSNGGAGALGDAAGIAAGLVGLPLAGYTAVLLSNSAVPVWKESARSLPALFVSSAASAATSILELTSLEPREQRIVHRFGLMSKVGELASIAWLERETENLADRVGRPLREGLSGAVLRGGKFGAAAGLALDLLAGRRKVARVASAILGTAGALAFKFGIFHAGKASARDPRATFQLQRAAMEERRAGAG